MCYRTALLAHSLLWGAVSQHDIWKSPHFTRTPHTRRNIRKESNQRFPQADGAPDFIYFSANHSRHPLPFSTPPPVKYSNCFHSHPFLLPARQEQPFAIHYHGTYFTAHGWIYVPLPDASSLPPTVPYPWSALYLRSDNSRGAEHYLSEHLFSFHFFPVSRYWFFGFRFSPLVSFWQRTDPHCSG